MEELCPCCSGKNYIDCCEIFHEGKPSISAEQLMRSRYSAYAKGLADYLMQTTHVRNPQYENDASKWRKQILKYAETTLFEKLTILSSEDLSHNFASVTFLANMKRQNKDASFIEKSLFEKINDRWYYLSGVIAKP